MARAEAQPPAQAAAQARADQAYRELRQRFQATPDHAEVAWQFGRACFDVADLANSTAVRAERAQEGMAACRRAIQADPKLAQGPYYLALNIGQLARTKSLGALKLVPQMEAALLQAIALDPNFDYAGPHRSLGLLYLDAPGWPISLGSRTKARHHLQKAVELSPEFPENWIALLEAYQKGHDHRLVESQLPVAATKIHAARQRFTGEEWALSWLDWNRRWEQLQAKAAGGHRPAENR